MCRSVNAMEPYEYTLAGSLLARTSFKRRCLSSLPSLITRKISEMERVRIEEKGDLGESGINASSVIIIKYMLASFFS